MNVELVIRTLKEVSGWIGPNQYLDQTIERLEHYDQLTAQERGQLKHLLSRDMLFHIRWLGDRDVPGFIGDGTSYAWWNYLGSIADLCQKNL